jgi:Na+-translocating ferredoxin:NAD+ oxidoreductase subunit A
MNLHALLQLAVAAALINNIVFTLMIGVCPLCGGSRKVSGAAWMGAAMMIVMGIASPAVWAFNRYVLVPHALVYLSTLSSILIIVSLVQFLEIALEKLVPRVYEAIGAFLPIVATNCAVLAVCLLGTANNPVTGTPFGAVDALVNGIASGAGFLLAIVMMAGVQSRLELTDVPGPLKGLPITLLSAGIASLAFLGFAGLSFKTVFGG